MKLEWKESKYINYLDGAITDFSYISNPPIVMQQKFVDEVVGVIVLENYFHPMLLDIMFYFLMIKDFTNANIDHVLNLINSEEPIDYWEQESSIEEYLNDNNLSSVIRDAYGASFINALYDNIMTAIEYKTGIHTSKLETELVRILTVLGKYLTDIDVDSMSKFVQKVNSIDNISADDIIKAYIAEQPVKTEATGEADTIGPVVNINK